MIYRHIIFHSLIYGGVTTLLLFIMMISFSPRVWGYSDYSDKIKTKISPQTKKEKQTAVILFVPFIIVFAIPIFSTIWLKSKLGGDISFIASFISLLAMFFSSFILDMVVLDFLVVSKITPNFVIIAGTEKDDYKDFTHHYIGHAKATPILVAICAVIAVLISIF